MPITVKPSTRKEKKYMAVIDYPGLKRTIHFGAKGMSDYTQHKDPERKKRYDARHSKLKGSSYTDPLKASFWAKKVLWTYPSLQKAKSEAIKEAKRILKSKGY